MFAWCKKIKNKVGITLLVITFYHIFRINFLDFKTTVERKKFQFFSFDRGKNYKLRKENVGHITNFLFLTL